jgi:hypothetical protein
MLGSTVLCEHRSIKIPALMPMMNDVAILYMIGKGPFERIMMVSETPVLNVLHPLVTRP